MHGRTSHRQREYRERSGDAKDPIRIPSPKEKSLAEVEVFESEVTPYETAVTSNRQRRDIQLDTGSSKVWSSVEVITKEVYEVEVLRTDGVERATSTLSSST